MTISYKNRVKQAITTGGTGAVVIGAASAGYQALAAGQDGLTLPYVLIDGTAWEAGTGTYTNSSTTFARTTREDSSTGSAINVTTSGFFYVDLTAATVAGLAALATHNSFTAGQAVTPVALTDGSSIATNAALSNNFRVTLGGNRTLANPTNLTDGQNVTWRITQDGTGSRTLAYGSMFLWPGATPPVLSTAIGAVDLISGIYWADTGKILATILEKFG